MKFILFSAFFAVAAMARAAPRHDRLGVDLYIRQAENHLLLKQLLKRVVTSDGQQQQQQPPGQANSLGGGPQAPARSASEDTQVQGQTPQKQVVQFADPLTTSENPKKKPADPAAKPEKPAMKAHSAAGDRELVAEEAAGQSEEALRYAEFAREQANKLAKDLADEAARKAAKKAAKKSAGGATKQGGQNMVPAGGATEQGGQNIVPAGGATEQGGQNMVPAGGATEQGGQNIVPTGDNLTSRLLRASRQRKTAETPERTQFRTKIDAESAKRQERILYNHAAATAQKKQKSKKVNM